MLANFSHLKYLSWNPLPEYSSSFFFFLFKVKDSVSVLFSHPLCVKHTHTHTHTQPSSSSFAASRDFSNSLSLAIHPYHLSFPAGLLDYILCLYRAVVGKFLLVGQHWHIHVKGTIEHHLWVHPCFSSSVLHVLFILFGWFLWWKVDVHIAVSSDVASRICSV